MAKKVFLSYSHRDHKLRDQLLRFLRPLERGQQVSYWDDTRIETGEIWADEINEALEEAGAVVLLITQDFLDSDFIAERELPRILARAELGELTVLPVFAGHSIVDLVEYAFVHPDTAERRQVNLSRFQGYGSPDKPLDRWPARERAFVKLAGRLAALLGDESAAARRSVPRRPRLESRIEADEVESHYQLTVQLERDGDEVVSHYHLPGGEPIGPYRRPMPAALADAHLALDRAEPAALERWIDKAPDTLGPALFELLFGGKGDWQPILRTVFGAVEGAAGPLSILAPLRLRIASADGDFLALPWSLTCWEQHLLIDDGWTFCTTDLLEPTLDLATPTPAPFLIITPPPATGAVALDGHLAALRDTLEQVWPRGEELPIRLAHSPAEVERALGEFKPRIIYLLGELVVHRGRPGLKLGGRKVLRLVDLAKRLGGAAGGPQAVFLNTHGFVRPPAPAQIFGRELPLLVWRRLAAWNGHTSHSAIAWLRAWLGAGADPVKALADLATRELNPELTGLLIHANYRSWKTHLYLPPARLRVAHLLLDRRIPKAIVNREITELVRSDSRRVLALVAYGDPGTGVELHWEQLQHDLDLEAKNVEIDFHQLSIPEERPAAADAMQRSLEEALALDLDALPGEGPRDLLLRRAPRAVGDDKAVLWLVWGTFGHGDEHQPPLKPQQLEAWLRFVAEYLGHYCPATLRVVCFLALEVDSRGRKRLQTALGELRRRPWAKSRDFRFGNALALSTVPEDELQDFLKDSRNSTCPEHLAVEAAQLIHRDSGGHFKATVALIEEAEKGSWLALLDRLRGSETIVELDDEAF